MGEAEDDYAAWETDNVGMIEANLEVADLREENARLRRALGYFIADERFQVGVGGNPRVVERMLAEVRAIYDGLK